MPFGLAERRSPLFAGWALYSTDNLHLASPAIRLRLREYSRPPHRERRETRGFSGSGSIPRSQLTVGLPALELFERAGPVFTEQTRQCAIGEETAARLAPGTVIGFVGRVPDALDRRAAHRTRLAEAAVRGHALAKRRDLRRKRIARGVDESIAPRREHRACHLEQARALV